uniref:Uncharacterized protein n=1 Tax=Vespula pensylvanica TaxID=30213 RepID=A0A834PD83_VESPE|nr:hypothetical protein H0235_000029 [Vespula pensylvanica]
MEIEVDGALKFVASWRRGKGAKWRIESDANEVRARTRWDTDDDPFDKERAGITTSLTVALTNPENASYVPIYVLLYGE